MSNDAYPIGLVRGVPVVATPAFIDLSNAEIVQSAFLRAASWGYATIVADMSGTRFCDSCGVSVLVLAHKKAQAEGGQLRLAAVTPPVLRLLAVTGLDRLLCVFPDVAEAVAELPAIAIAPWLEAVPSIRSAPALVPS